MRSDFNIRATIGAVILTIAGGFATHFATRTRGGEIPVAFAEHGQVVRHFKEQGKEVPPLNQLYMAINEVAMKVFESYNNAFKAGDSNQALARELEKRVKPELREHTLITTYTQEIPAYGDDAIRALQNLMDALHDLPPIGQELRASWTEDHKHYDREEIKPTQVCDSKGKNCRIENKKTQVYDHTDHKYWFHRDHARKAAELLTAFTQRYPELKIAEQLITATNVQAPNREAIISSRKSKLKKKSLNDLDFAQLAATWATGSNLTVYRGEIQEKSAELTQVSPLWRNASQADRSASYRTNSKSHDGPYEYKLAKNLDGTARAVYEDSKIIIDGIYNAIRNSGKLEGRIKAFIRAVNSNNNQEADKLRVEILDTAKEMYQKNFEYGFDVRRFKWEWILLGMILGGGIGGSAGYMLDQRYRNSAHAFRDGPG